MTLLLYTTNEIYCDVICHSYCFCVNLFWDCTVSIKCHYNMFQTYKHDVPYSTAVPEVEHQSQVNSLTSDTPYLALTGKLWGIYCMKKIYNVTMALHYNMSPAITSLLMHTVHRWQTEPNQHENTQNRKQQIQIIIDILLRNVVRDKTVTGSVNMSTDVEITNNGKVLFIVLILPPKRSAGKYEILQWENQGKGSEI